MIRLRRLFVAVLLVAALAGCPPFVFPNLRFTSANPNGNGMYGPIYDSPDTATGTEGEGETREREVVEPDVIRRAGNWLYILNQYRGLSIVNLDTEKLVAQVPTYGYPRDLYVVGDRAYVLVAYAGGVVTEGGVLSYDIRSRVYVLDISEPAATAISGQFDLEGDFVDSRLVGDVLYAISAEFEWYWEDVAVVKSQTSSSWVTSINVTDPANIYQSDQLSFEGYGNVIQATPFALFVAASNWNTGDSVITYVDISDPSGLILVRDAIQVHGNIPDRFKMDAYQGVLRVVSNTWWPNRDVFVTTVDLSNPDELAVLGETTIPNASGETLFATRFDGPRAYVVTYLVVDPLFVLDLSEPANPVVAGFLEVPGWSTHIEPQGDRLVALGVDDTAGRQVKVSLYDVSDPAAPGEIETVSFGEGWSWSSAYEDVKAFTVLDDMLIVPFSGWSEDAGGFERLQFVGYTPDDLELHGHVDLDGHVLRSFEYGEFCYGVTTEQLAVIDARDPNAPEVVHRITLAEYVQDFQELSGELGVEILSHFDSAATLVRTVDASGAKLGDLKLETFNLANTFVYGDSVVLVSTGWDQHGYYDVAIVDCSAPDAPQLRAQVRVDVDPFWGGWWYDGPWYAPGVEGDGGMMVDAENKQAAGRPYDYWWPWYSTGDTAYLLGNKLALRCSAQDYDVTLGSRTPGQGIAIVDLDAGAWTQTIGLGYDGIVRVDAESGKLYLSTQEDAGITLIGQSLVAYFVRELTLDGPAASPAANVPGEFLRYDPDQNLLLVRDYQYTFVQGIQQSVRSLRWDGGESVELLDSHVLTDYYGSLLARGAYVYLERWNNGYEVQALRAAKDGDLSSAGTAKMGEQWINLLDADGPMLYVDAGGRAVARYDFTAHGALKDLIPVMNSALRIRFGEEKAYAPLGYAGLVRLER